MKKLNTDYKFLDVSYFYKLFGSVVKGMDAVFSPHRQVYMFGRMAYRY